MKISEHQRQTEFLKECLLYDKSAESQELRQVIFLIQCDARCVQRAAWMMALLIGVAAVVLGYPAIMVEGFPYGAPQFIVNVICALGAGALVSFLAFAGLGVVYRRKLNQRREECCRKVARLLASRLGKPG